MKKAVIDGDYIIYIATAKRKILDENNQPLKDDKNRFIYRDITLEEALTTCDSYINDLLHAVGASYFLLCLTAPKNFRYKIASDYKSNRTQERPMWFNEVKQHLKDNWNGFEVEGLEADDLVVILRNNISDSFIVAVDKDILYCIEGTHYSARFGKSEFITTTKEQAEFNFAKSILVGDSIDGIPNIKRGYGPKTAEKELLASTDTDLRETALKIYQREYGETEGLFRFMTQINLLKIIENFDELPEGINFVIPKLNCFNCIEDLMDIDLFTNNKIINEI